MSSPTQEIIAAELDDGVHAQLLEEVKKTIAPLAAEEQAALDEARAYQDIPPEPANAAADQLESGAFLTEMDSLDTNAIAKIISELSKSSSFVTFESINTNGHTPIVFPKAGDANAMDSVHAANDDWSGGGTFSAFESDIMNDIVAEHSIRITTRSDCDGRRFFYFDNGVNISLSAVLFEMKGVRMVKLNNTILSLDTLLSLKRCVNLPNMGKKESHLTQNFQGGVECTFGDDVSLEIPNISVDSIMIVISHLSLVYAPATKAVTTDAASEGPISAANKSDSWMTPWAKEVLIHAGVNVLCALGGYLLGLKRV